MNADSTPLEIMSRHSARHPEIPYVIGLPLPGLRVRPLKIALIHPASATRHSAQHLRSRMPEPALPDPKTVPPGYANHLE